MAEFKVLKFSCILFSKNEKSVKNLIILLPVLEKLKDKP